MVISQWSERCRRTNSDAEDATRAASAHEALLSRVAPFFFTATTTSTFVRNVMLVDRNGGPQDELCVSRDESVGRRQSDAAVATMNAVEEGGFAG